MEYVDELFGPDDDVFAEPPVDPTNFVPHEQRPEYAAYIASLKGRTQSQYVKREKKGSPEESDRKKYKKLARGDEPIWMWGYTSLPNALYDAVLIHNLPASCKLIGMALLRHSFGWAENRGFACLSNRRMSKLTGISTSTVRDAVETLKERGFVEHIGSDADTGTFLYKLDLPIWAKEFLEKHKPDPDDTKKQRSKKYTAYLEDVRKYKPEGVATSDTGV
jgi:DNA-binding transcriptional regulator YhcF (GntR family)